MFQFARLSPDRPIDSAGGNAALPALGFPIRESTGQRSFNTSPWLIAVVHALLRLLVPRHPPCALNILTVIRPDANAPSGDTRIDLASCAVFKVRREGAEPRWPSPSVQEAPARPVSQNSTACVMRPRERDRKSPRSGRHARNAAASKGRRGVALT